VGGGSWTASPHSASMARLDMLSISGIRSFPPTDDQDAEVRGEWGVGWAWEEGKGRGGRASNKCAANGTGLAGCAQRITFTKPLTVIVGMNGCGKTVRGCVGGAWGAGRG
jgi:hypothetical protein